MSSERLKKAVELLLVAIEQPAEQRHVFIKESCGTDNLLCEEVESLLAAHQKVENLKSLPEANGATLPLSKDAGRLVAGPHIGSYRIIREIGRGGMGTVYLAERADRQYKKQVAVKLIKSGTDTDSVLQYFRNERQILANFDHPNIARLLDGGSTDAGLPFFVMEYVEGKGIDEYCNEQDLNITQRLELFQQVCSAVTYAHRHLVVHRDIKPSNILVTAEGTPKLLDFGIAKILQSESSTANRVTATHTMAMTPEYASPEQLQGLPVTTATDVYSLGVVLYELLTGFSPYTFTNRLPLEIARIITTGDLQLPSTMIRNSQSETGKTQSLSKIPEGSIERLCGRLRGDVDNIVMMAMRKEPERRYQSVEQFSEDIRRHLVGLPVTARPITLSYRLSKFVRRNRIAVALAALIFLTLIGGILTTAWQSYRAETERARAERRFNDVRKLASSVLFDYHDAIKDLPGSTPVRARLVKDALKYLDSLAAEEHNDTSLQIELAAAYERIGDVQGGTMKANLGDTEGSIKSYRKALGILQSLNNTDPQNKETRYKIAVCSQKLGTLLWETGDLKGSLEESRKALTLLEQLVAENPSNFNARLQLVGTLNRIGSILLEQNDFSGALKSHQKELDLYKSFSATELKSEEVRRTESITYEHIATVQLAMGDFDKALENNLKAVEISEALSKDFPNNATQLRRLSVNYYWEGEILWKSGRFVEALKSYQKDVDIVEKLYSLDPKNEVYRGDLAYALNRIGDVQLELKNPEQAITNYERAKSLRTEDVKTDPSNLWKRSALVGTQSRLCQTLANSGQAEKAKKECTLTISLMEQTKLEPTNAADRSVFADSYTDVGEAYSMLAMKPSSCEMYRKSLEIWQDLQAKGILPTDSPAKMEWLTTQLTTCNKNNSNQ